ncbi:amino acid adenylation domain-containing protein [Streptomyces flaveolus]|uniref:non-ribosomal peptide synthetase/type I polyketide synthase n=1 Tax=Streptomyces flaveolus TaxID=67297 RepID=UPI003423E05B
MTTTCLPEDTQAHVVPAQRKDRPEALALTQAVARLHTQGRTVDWSALFAPSRATAAPLPTYAFQHQRYWLPATSGARTETGIVAAGLTPADHAWLTAVATLPDNDGHLLSGRLSPRTHPWLADHAVFGGTLVPGTGLVDVALAAARAVGATRVRELTLAKPLMADTAVRLQVRVEGPDEHGHRALAVYSQLEDTPDPGTWQLNATGEVADATAADDGVQAAPELTGWPVPDTDPVDLGGFYEGLDAQGFTYGPAFRALEELRTRGRVAYGRVVLPEAAGTTEGYGVHPALLDSALHVLAGITSADDRPQGDAVVLPFAWSDVELYATGSTELRVRIELLEPEDRAPVASVLVTDAEGAPVLRARALRMQRATAQQLRAAQDAGAEHLYRLDFQRIRLERDAQPETGGEGLLVLGDGTVAEALGVTAAEELAEGAAPRRLVVDLTADRTGDPAADARDSAVDALALVQRVLADEHLHGTEVVWVTRDAVAARPEDGAGALADAAVWGLVRTARAEQPERLLRLVDVGTQPLDPAILHAALAADGEPELVLRGDGGYVPRLVRAQGAGTAVAVPAGDAPWHLTVREKGRLDALTAVPVDRSAPLGAGEVRVRVRASGLNFRDVLNALDMVHAPELGLEFAGDVVEAGSEVMHLRVGDRVMGLSVATFGTEVRADARVVARIPEGLGYAQAATVPLAFLTAYYALTDLGGLRAGEKVLVHAAAGGVGMAAVQLARHLGAEVYGTASEGKWPALRALGLADDRIASSRDTGFAEKWHGHGIGIVLNALTGEFVDASLGLLGEGGRFLEMGKTDVRDADEVAAVHAGVRYQAFDLIESGPQRIREMFAILTELLADGALAPLPYTAYDLRNAPDALRYMGQGRHTGKLVLTAPRPLDPQGTVLITGGTGELGRAVAERLVREHGVRHLVLTGRRGPDAPGAAAVSAALEEAGAADVRIVACDVAVRDQVAAVLADVPDDRPWTAVLHLAGVIDDGMVAGQNAERLAAVFGPKVDGAVHLHELTAGLDLAAFVLFSSAAGTLGSPGQSNYAAANAFLDALAAHRRHRGLPAVSLSWGLWAQHGTGMTAHLGEAELARMRRQGAHPLTLAEGLDLLDAALCRPEPHLVPVKFDLAALGRGAGVPALLRALVRPRAELRQAAQSSGGGTSLRDRLAATAEAERGQVLTEAVRREVAVVMGVSGADGVGADQELKELGIDSLMAVELRKRLSDLAGAALPSDLAFSHPTPRAIALFLLTEAFADLGAPAGTTSASRAAGPELPALARAEGATAYPATHGQRRLWFMEHLHPGSAQYNCVLRQHTARPLDPEVLARAVAWVVDRHESLRTTLRAEGGDVVQVVHPSLTVPLVHEDLSHADEEAVAARLREEEQTPFTVDGGTLLRGLVLTLPGGGQLLCFVLHHAITDGWSSGIFLHDLYEAYHALRDGRDPQRPAVEHQVGDYALWEDRWVREGRFAPALDFFGRELAGVPRLEFPPGPPGASDSGADGDAVYFTVPAGLRDAVESLATAANVTPYTVLVTAYAVLLERYCGQDDFAVGTVWGNRQVPGTANLAGFLANTLPLRCDLSGDPTFTGLLAAMRSRVLGALEHQSVPLTEIVRTAAGERTGEENPFFRAAFNYISASAPALGEGEDAWTRPATGSALGNVRGAAKFELGLTLVSDETGLRGELEFQSHVLGRAAAQRMTENFTALLDSVVRDPNTPLARLEALGQSELASLRERAGTVTPELTDPRTALERILDQARSTPDAVALVHGEHRLTYRELVSRAGSVAQRLGAQEVGADVLVGVHAPRSAAFVVLALGVWLAGGAYVPIDPAYPASRIDHMVRDSGMRVVLTTPGHPLAVDADGLEVLSLDAVTSPGADAEIPDALPALSDLAYAIYTSGSTGTPKGVLLEHAQFANFCTAMDDRVGGGPGHTWLAVTSPSFDISTVELLWTLTRGYRVIVADGTVADWGRYRDAAPTHLQCTPSLARMLLADRDGRALLGGLDRLLVGGEALDRALAKKLLRHCTGRITNMYGPTETTVWSSAWTLEPGIVSLGEPLHGNRLYLLDAHRRPVPQGAHGELWIGGHGVARGYHHRPELTGERFAPDPHSPVPGARMYRTGDIVRYRPDGTLEFCGRTDAQIKLRGHRIELGEIESVAGDHPAVLECAAIVREDTPGDPALFLYWTPADGTADGSDLRAHLAGRLPAYMVPARLVRMAELPHTPNEKTDRNALKALPLPALDSGAEATGDGSAEAAHATDPAQAVEDVVARAWQAVLGLPRVDRDTGFFELGGTSMSALSAHQAICAELGREFPLATVFRHPTVRRLAAHLSGTGTSTGPAARTARHASGDPAEDAIAVVGLACRLPGAPDIDSFWQALREGRELISRFTEAELREAGVPEALLTHPSYVRAKGYVEDVDRFDAGFFGYSRTEAEAMDPQHRLFLECAWEGLENAGIVPQEFDGPIAVFGGSGSGGYQQHEINDLSSFFRNMVGTKGDFLAPRVAHKLNLRGPALNVQTACSTGLVATHLARESLLRGESDIALVGASSVSVPLKNGYPYQEGMVVSPDGSCRAFDADGAGTVFGDGVGVVVLRRLSDALAAGDTVYAVVRGSAINNDGSDKVGFTAPSVAGQAQVIATAHSTAGISADSVGFIEAHGTGTALGDPIEVQALQEVFRGGERDEPCALGSVKTNIGHTDATAGVAGLIKTVLTLHHRELVPTLHFKRPNPDMDLDPDLFYVNTETRDWVWDGPRRAGVSAFGIGGTNAHVVLEEAPAPVVDESAADGTDGALPVVLSARDTNALRAQAARWADWLDAHPEVPLRRVAVSAATRREHFGARASVTAATAAEAGAAFAALAERRSHPALDEGTAADRRVVFVFPGQDTEWAGMGRELLEQSEVFARAVAECDAAFAPFTGRSMTELLREGDGSQWSDLGIVQPLRFTMYVALAAVWRSLGVEPAAVVGHSQGEAAAAVVAGALTLQEGARVIAARSAAMQRQSGSGRMAVVELPPAEAQTWVAQYEGTVSIAAVNTPHSVTVSGDADAVDDLLFRLDDEDIACGPLEARMAAHSHHVDPVLPVLAEELAELRPRAGQIPIYSTVTGDRVRGEELDAAYWCRNLRRTARLDLAHQALLAAGFDVFVEVSPHPVLLMPLTDGALYAGYDQTVTVPTLQRDQGDLAQVLRGVGRLHVHGAGVDWTRALGDAPAVPLPTYAFQRERYWAEPQTTPERTVPAATDAFWQAVDDGGADRVAKMLGAPEELRAGIAQLLPLLSAWQDEQKGRSAIASWLYDEVWRPAEPAASGPVDGDWALVTCPGQAADAGYGEQIERELRLAGATVHRIDGAADRAGLARALQALPSGLLGVVTLAGLDDTADAQGVTEGLRGVLALVQAVGDTGRPVPVWALTSGTVSVDGVEPLPNPLGSLVRGVGRVVSLEQPQRWGGVIDVPPLPHEDWAAQFVLSLGAGDHEDEVALRPGGRFVRRMVRTAPQPGEAGWSTSGTALITGGTGGLGRHLAHWLAGRGATRIVLASRRALETDEITALRADLAAKGTEVVLVPCDVSDRTQVEKLIASAETAGAPLRTVAHLAGVSAAAPLDSISDEELGGELAAKAHGARHVHEVLGDRPLDAFVLYGSGAGLWGSGHQAVYAAANIALDALARERHLAGLPATVLHWGRWAVDGILSAEEEESVRARGLMAMEPGRALHALGLALDAGLPALGVADIDWARFAPAYSAARPRPLIGDIDDVRTALAATDAPLDPHAGDDLRAELTGMDRQERLRTLTRLVRTEVAQALSMEVHALDVEQPLLQLGFDSLMAVTVRGALARRTGLALTTNVFVRHSTCAALGRHLLGELLGGEQEPQADADSSWLRVLKPAARPRARIVCMPGMGGTAGGYIPLIGALPEGVELVGVQLPGREARTDEPPLTDMMKMADEVAAALADRCDVPLVLFGHSQGAWLAWEVAHRLGLRPEEPQLSLVVACAQTPYAEVSDFVRRAGVAAGRDGASPAEIAEALDGLLPRQILDNEELLVEYAQRLHADTELGASHRRALTDLRRESLKVPVFAVAATDDPVAAPQAMEAWRELSLGAFSLHTIAGSHAAPLENAEAMVAELLAAVPADGV